MMSMQKTTFGSKFAIFEKRSPWYDAVFNNRKNGQTVPVDPTKKKDSYTGWDYSECDEIVILQLQQEGEKFMIEYVYK